MQTEQQSGEDNGSTEIEGDDRHLHDDQKAAKARNGNDKDATGLDPNGTPGGQQQEEVEDRPNVSTVTPEDYPSDLPDH